MSGIHLKFELHVNVLAIINFYTTQKDHFSHARKIKEFQRIFLRKKKGNLKEILRSFMIFKELLRLEFPRSFNVK